MFEQLLLLMPYPLFINLRIDLLLLINWLLLDLLFLLLLFLLTTCYAAFQCTGIIGTGIHIHAEMRATALPNRLRWLIVALILRQNTQLIGYLLYVILLVEIVVVTHHLVDRLIYFRSSLIHRNVIKPLFFKVVVILVIGVWLIHLFLLVLFRLLRRPKLLFLSCVFAHVLFLSL